MGSRTRLAVVALAGATACGTTHAGAPAAYPERPVRLVVPFTPRGTSDVVARILADRLGVALAQTVLVDNRAGAGGTLGADIVAKFSPDGHTLLYGAKSVAINASLYRSLPYDVIRDFAPVTLIQETPYLFVASDKLPAATMPEVIALARSQPGKLSYASGGAGTGPQMAMELLKLRLNLDIVHVPYKGSAPALRDVVAGYVELQCASLIAALQFLNTGRLRALAISSTQRARLLPDVPTMQEAGIAGYDESGWAGILVRSGTPRSVIDRLQREFATLVQRPDVVAAMDKEGARPRASTPEAYARLLQEEVAKWADVVRRTGIVPQ